MKTFWILWNPEGKTPPTVQFETAEKAMAQAARLQQRIGLGTMYVLKAEAAFTVAVKTKWESVK